MENIFFQNENFKWIDLEEKKPETIKKWLKSYSISHANIHLKNEIGHFSTFENYSNFDFFLLRYFKKSHQPQVNSIKEFSQKLFIYLGKDFLITIHPEKVSFFNELKEGLKDETAHDLSLQEFFTRIFRLTIRSFYPTAEKTSESIDYYENFLFTDQSSKVDLKKLYELKRKTSSCLKILRMNQGTINEYKTHTNNPGVLKEIQDYYSIVYQLHDQNYEDLRNLFELTTSLADMRANKVMKILTLFAAFFLPLTFISGIYGMNFKNMPELEWDNGYFIILGLMASIVIGVFIWFKKEKFF